MKGRHPYKMLVSAHKGPSFCHCHGEEVAFMNWFVNGQNTEGYPESLLVTSK